MFNLNLPLDFKQDIQKETRGDVKQTSTTV